MLQQIQEIRSKNGIEQEKEPEPNQNNQYDTTEFSLAYKPLIEDVNAE